MCPYPHPCRAQHVAKHGMMQIHLFGQLPRHVLATETRRSVSRLLCVFLDRFLVRRRLRPSERQPAASNGSARECWPTVAIDEAHLLLQRRCASAVLAASPLRSWLPPTATSLSQLATTPHGRPNPTFHAGNALQSRIALAKQRKRLLKQRLSRPAAPLLAHALYYAITPQTGSR